jgi:HEAT repeat protein
MHGEHRHFVIARRALAMMVWVFVLAVRLAPAHAEERVAVLTKMLTSSSDKTRLSAVLALAKLGNRAVEKPLVTALRDPSVRVRVVAVAALGRLACQAALPTLRTMASTDDDTGVRQAANNAAIKIAQAPRPADTVHARPSPGATRAAGVIDEPHADLYLLVNASADDSPGTADKLARRAHAEIIKRVLIEQLRGEASVTSIANDAHRWGLEARHLDLSVTKLEVANAGGYIEIGAELRLAVSDDHGKMLSFLSGGAKVAGRNAKLSAPYMPALRREALENAMHGMFGKLLAHLHEPPT